MPYRTTIVETQTQTVENAVYQITTFEQAINAFCDYCDNQASGTKENLRNRGWNFGGGLEFCPECN